MKTTSAAVSSLCLAALCASDQASALNLGGVEVGIQPRVEAGLLYYEYQQDPVAVPQLSIPNVQLDGNFSQEKLRLKDTMPTISGGLTIFADRFFLDLSALTTLSDGEDSDTFEASQFGIGQGVSFFRTRESLEVDFDRDEYAISLGYSVTEQLAVFAGYKWAKTDFQGSSNGSFSLLSSLGFGEGTFTVDQDFELEHDGPFVGVNYGFEVNAGFLEGALSFNFAAAFLEGDTNSNSQGGQLTLTSVNGEPLPSPVVEEFEGTEIANEGETIGLTFGIGWRGFTPVENLTYAINVTGYKYDFDGEDESADFNESALAFKLGVGYAF